MQCLKVLALAASCAAALAGADAVPEPVEKVENGAAKRFLQVAAASQTGYGGSSGFGTVDWSAASRVSGSSSGADNAQGPTIGLFGVAGGEYVVYFIGAFFTVIYAFMYKTHVVDVILRENRGPLKEFSHEATALGDDFEYGLLDCLGDPCMVIRLLFPCTTAVRQAHTMSVVSDESNRGVLAPFWCVLGSYMCGGLCCCLPPLCLTMYFRKLLKDKMHLEDHCVNDFCLAWLCTPCTIGQMAGVVDRELGYEVHYCCDLMWDEEHHEEYAINNMQ